MKIDKQILVYFSVLGVILLLILINSRAVLFVAWTGRTWISLAPHKETVYIPGGIDMHHELNDQILVMDLEKKTLKRAGTLPSPRYSTSSVYIDPYVYIIGGYDEDSSLSEVVRFDPREGISEVIMELPEPRTYGAAVFHKNKILYVGGFNGSNAVNTILEINIENLSSSVVATLPEPVNFHSVVSLDSSLYILGGENGKGESLASIYEIDPMNGQVLRQGLLPNPIIRSSASIMNDSIYMMGGWGKGGPRNSIIRIDLKDKNLASVIEGEMDRAYSDIPLYAYGDELFLIGGIEERYERQLNVLSYKPQQAEQEIVKLKSYAWWHR